MNMLVVNGQLYSRSTGARITTLMPALQKIVLLKHSIIIFINKMLLAFYL